MRVLQLDLKPSPFKKQKHSKTNRQIKQTKKSDVTSTKAKQNNKESTMTQNKKKTTPVLNRSKLKPTKPMQNPLKKHPKLWLLEKKSS